MDAMRMPYMCGHGTIGSVKVWGDLMSDSNRSHVTISTPAGIVSAELHRHGGGSGRVSTVALQLESGFHDRTEELEVRGKRLKCDLVCVGGYFAMIALEELDAQGLLSAASKTNEVAALGMEVIREANEQLKIQHPTAAHVNTCDVAEFYWDGGSMVIYGDHHVDRSPCGTGTLAKMALLYHRKQLAVGESILQKGPLGTCFRGTIVKEVQIGDKPGIVPQIQAAAHITGRSTFIISREDPFPTGFLL